MPGIANHPLCLSVVGNCIICNACWRNSWTPYMLEAKGGIWTFWCLLCADKSIPH